VFAVLVALHVACALVGFGSVAVTGVYGGIARHLERPGALGDARRWFAQPNRAKWALVGVPFFGVAALFAGHRTGDFGHPWVGAALAVWAVAALVVFHVVAPAERRLRAALLQAAPAGAAPALADPAGAAPALADPAGAAPALADPAGAQPLSGTVSAGPLPGASGAATRLLAGTAVCDVAFVVALGLMVWQP
jgi:hypothetical protein